MKMSKNKSNILISLEQRQLLLNSKEIESYPELKTILEKYETVKSENLKDDILFTENIIITIKHSFSQIINNASSEWRQDIDKEDLGEMRVSCSLCKSPNRFVFYITNKNTMTKLNVGSDCIMKFPGFDFKDTIKKDKATLQRNAATTDRINRINQRFPFIKDNISDWFKVVEENPYVLPFQLEKDIKNSLNFLKSKYDDYINPRLKISASIFDVIEHTILKCNMLFKEIEEHNSFSKTNIFACTLKIKNWLKNNNYDNALYLIKQSDGFITNESIKCIYYEPFIMNFKDEIVSFFKIYKLEYDYIRDYEISLNYHISRDTLLHFKISLRDFAKCCIEMINDKLSFSLNDCFKYFHTEKSTVQDAIVIEYFNSILKATDYTILYHKKTNVLCYEKRITTGTNSGKYYTETNIDHFRKVIASYVFTQDYNTNVKSFKSILEALKNWKIENEYVANKVDERLITEAPPRYHRRRR